jgi:flavin-dependent dehydrogenase
VASHGAAYDVTVIGGGPAGLSAAIALAGRGLRVLVAEAKTYPHDKLCGEFLSPECAGLLEALGLAHALRALDAAPIETACLTAPDGTAWETRLPGMAWGLTRRALDAALAEQARAAGAEVRTGCAVIDLSGSLEAGYTLHTRLRGGRVGEVHARAVIAAHGKRAALDAALGRRFLRQPQPFVALKAHFRGPALPGRIELHGFPGGYCGLSEFEPRAGESGRAANVCLLVRAEVFSAAADGAAGPERVAAFLAWMRAQNPRLEAWLARATPLNGRWLSIAQVPFVGKQPVEAGVLLAGDAAGLIAPLAGDGIAMALRAGPLAAEYASDFLDKRVSAETARQGYARAWRREFGPRLRLARALQGWMLRPAWLGLGLRLLKAAPRLGTYLVVHTRDSRVVVG